MLIVSQNPNNANFIRIPVYSNQTENCTLSGHLELSKVGDCTTSNLQYKLTVTRMGNGTRIRVSEHDNLHKTIKK